MAELKDTIIYGDLRVTGRLGQPFVTSATATTSENGGNPDVVGSVSGQTLNLNFYNIRGVAGSVGPRWQGAVGPCGPGGNRGFTGTTGPCGPMGACGPCGPLGPRGGQGGRGTTGPCGPSGSPGSNGRGTYSLSALDGIAWTDFAISTSEKEFTPLTPYLTKENTVTFGYITILNNTSTTHDLWIQMRTVTSDSLIFKIDNFSVFKHSAVAVPFSYDRSSYAARFKIYGSSGSNNMTVGYTIGLIGV